MSLPNCPQCDEAYTYEDGSLLVCPMCSYEWTYAEQAAAEEAAVFRDVNGNELQNGDDVLVVSDLKAGSTVIKQGTKAKGIQLLDEPYNGHDISAKIDGIGSIYLKTSVVKKA